MAKDAKSGHLESWLPAMNSPWTPFMTWIPFLKDNRTHFLRDTVISITTSQTYYHPCIS